MAKDKKLNDNATRMPLRVAQLIKHTAWMNCQDRERIPTDGDKALSFRAVKMLAAIACLDIYFFDLQQEMEDAGLYHHALKKNINQSAKLAEKVNVLAYRLIADFNKKAGSAYNDKCSESVAKIDEAVKLEAPERAYNIVCALCRIISKLSREVRSLYDFRPADLLEVIPERISTDRVRDYKIDYLIEKQL